MKKNWIISMASVCMAAVLLTGCQSGGSSDYVQAVLDVAYGADTAEYAKLAKVSEADAKKDTEQSMQAEAKYLAAYFQMENPSQEVLDTFAEFSQSLYEKVSYEVSGSGEKVTVKIKPLCLLKNAKDDLETYLEEFNVKRYVDADTGATDEAFAKGVVQILSKHLEKAEYGDEVKVDITCSSKDGGYTVSDEDLNAVDEALVQ